MSDVQKEGLEACARLDAGYARLAKQYRPAARMRRAMRRRLRQGMPVSELADWRAQYARLRTQAERKRKGRWLDRKAPPTVDQVSGVGFDPIWDSPDNVARLEQTDRRFSELDVAIQTLAPDWLQSWFNFRNSWRKFYNAKIREAGAGARPGLDRFDRELRQWRDKAKSAGAKPRDPDYAPEPSDSEPVLSLRGIGAAALLGAALLTIYLLKKD